MINIVFSIDPTTDFLSAIHTNLVDAGIKTNLIEIHPSEKSYNTAKENIENLPKNSIILFLGHGQDNQLFGGESKIFKKDTFIKDNEMGIFSQQLVFLLACDSSGLLKRSFRFSKITKSIGFGALPTEMEEIKQDRKLNTYIKESSVIKFREAIVNLISNAFIELHKVESDFIWLKDYLLLLINKRINQAILDEKDNGLADLLFYMKLDLKMF